MYQESQSVAPKFLTSLVSLINGLLCVYFGYLFFSSVVSESPVFSANLPSWMSFILCTLFAGIAYFIINLRIQTNVGQKHLRLSMGLFGKKKIPLASIAAVKSFRGSPISGVMNQGHHLSSEQSGYLGQARDAVLITFKDKQEGELVITTEHSSELKAALLA